MCPARIAIMEDHPSSVFSSTESHPSPSEKTTGNGGDQVLLKSQPETPSLTRKVLAELVGTYVGVFVGCGSIMRNEISHGQLGVLGMACTVGIVIMVMIYTIGHVSGAHVNPAITLAFASSGKFPWREVPWYIGAQSVASIIAELTLKLVFHSPSLLDATVNRPANGDYLQAFVFEFIMGTILMFVVSGAATDSRAVGSMAGLVIGATITMNILYAGPVIGASMNPARSFGSAVVGNSYKGLYVYIFAPCMGTIFGSFVYNNILSIESYAMTTNQDKQPSSPLLPTYSHASDANA